MTRAYYSEFDPRMAATLRVLIAEGHIAPGDVDERSISDVTPHDLAGYRQCHFFAGIGVWSHALRNAGWPDDRPVWTGSCPCQPFSTAGKGLGFADERHLWPHWHWLVAQCQPDVIFGEQVSDKGGTLWLDLVSTDLEGTGYAIGALVAPAASVGAPHMRHRTYFGAKRLADADRDGLDQARGRGTTTGRDGSVGNGAAGGLDDSVQPRLEGLGGNGDDSRQPGWFDPFKTGPIAATGGPVRMGNPHGDGTGRFTGTISEPQTQEHSGRQSDGCVDHRPVHAMPGTSARPPAARPTNGFWRDVDWLHGRDGKWRPVGPGTFPLVDGAPARVGQLHGFGNAIVAPLATAFIEAFDEVMP